MRCRQEQKERLPRRSDWSESTTARIGAKEQSRKHSRKSRTRHCDAVESRLLRNVWKSQQVRIHNINSRIVKHMLFMLSNYILLCRICKTCMSGYSLLATRTIGRWTFGRQTKRLNEIQLLVCTVPYLLVLCSCLVPVQ